MPLYRFNIHNGNGLTEDLEGRHLPDTAHAREEAVKGIRSMLADDMLRGHLDLRGHLEISDETGASLFTIAFADAFTIDRPDGS